MTTTVDNKHNNNKNSNKSINNNITNDINVIDTNGPTLGNNDHDYHHSIINKTTTTNKHPQPSASTATTKTNGENNTTTNNNNNNPLTSPLLSQRHDDNDDNTHDNNKQNDYHHRHTSSTWSLSPLVSTVTDSIDDDISNNDNNHADDDDDDDDDDMKDSHSMHNIANLKTWALGVIIYYNVAGGPFGIEPTIRSSGPLYSLLGFLLAPLLFSVPECLVTAELGSVYPGAAGGVAWVTEAFGDAAGLVMGYMSYVAGAANLAIYPVLFLEYVVQLFRNDDDYDGDGEEEDDAMDVKGRLLFVTGLISLLSLVNYWGLEIVGRMAQVIAFVAMSPFFVMIVLGIPQIEPSRWLVPPISPPPSEDDDDGDGSPIDGGWFPTILFAGVLWQPYLNNLYWNNNSYDSAAHLSGEIIHDDLSSTYPHAILLSLLLVSLGNFLPLLVALGAVDAGQEEWVDGYLTTACATIGGTWLGAWAVFAAGISSLAQFESGLSTESFGIYGMSQRGLLPKVFSRKSRFRTPTAAILLTYAIVMVMSLADFSSLVEMLNFNYSIALLMEYGAFVKLRLTTTTTRWDDDDDDMERPYRIPLPTWACVLMLIPPCVVIMLILCMASYLTYAIFAGFVCLGLFMRYMFSVAKVRGWCDFVDHSREMMMDMTDDDRSSSIYGGEYILVNTDDENDIVQTMAQHIIT